MIQSIQGIQFFGGVVGFGPGTDEKETTSSFTKISDVYFNDEIHVKY